MIISLRLIYAKTDTCPDVERVQEFMAILEFKNIYKSLALTTELVAYVILTCMKYLISIKTEIIHQVLQTYCYLSC